MLKTLRLVVYPAHQQGLEGVIEWRLVQLARARLADFHRVGQGAVLGYVADVLVVLRLVGRLPQGVQHVEKAGGAEEERQ